MSSQPNTRPTLFLDFDGVLHPGHSKAADYFCKVPLLVKAIGQADVSIVISSSWRFHWTYEQIKANFPESIKSKIDGMTGGAFIGRHARWNEIKTCVLENKMANWRSLDDSHFEFPNPCPELILCEGSRGLEQNQVAEIRLWLATIPT